MIPLLLFGYALAAPLDPGAYRLDAVVVTESKVPFAGWITVLTRSTSLARLERGPGGWTQSQRLCGVAVEDTLKQAHTIFPPAFVAAQPEQQFPVSVADGPDGWTYAADPGPLDVGWDPSEAGGRLPESPRDPGVTDPDHDGHPGATIGLKVPFFRRVDLYIAQHGHTLYEGRVEGGRVVGRLDVRALAQRNLGASNRLFASNPPMHALPGKSTFTLDPVPAGTTCSDLWPVGRTPAEAPGS